MLGGLTNTAFALTDELKTYVFKKLYKEYSYCANYYYILASGIKKRPNYSSSDEKIFKHIMKLHSEADKNLMFFSTKLEINVKKATEDAISIAKKLNTIIEYNYSKIERLDKTYALSCKESLLNPKGRMEFWDKEYHSKLTSRKSSSGNPEAEPNRSKSLVNTKLICDDLINSESGVSGYTIVSKRKAIFHKIEDYKIKDINLTYNSDVYSLHFFSGKKKFGILNRETLKWRRPNVSRGAKQCLLCVVKCSITTIPIKTLLEFDLENKFKKQKIKNKI
jgi:hypothetical protein